jgi:ribosomal-protein-alanine N-acetyltransferase
MQLKLIPITTDKASMQVYLRDVFSIAVNSVYVQLYPKIGFNLPWVGYFVLLDNEVVGVGGYKGAPKGNTVEIAYGTVPKKEGKGYATKICEQLTILAFKEEPNIKVTARTLMEESASTQILKNNGYKFMGVVEDSDDGQVWEWEYVGK